MSEQASSVTRRTVLATTAAAGAFSLLPEQLAAAAGAEAIRPFTISFPDDDLAELRRRVAATRWPERETVTDATQGVQLATTQKLADYWAKDYDWRRCEAQLNAAAELHHRDRRARHPFHSRALEA